MVEFFKKPVSAEDIAETRKQARNMFKVAGVLIALTILWAIIWSAPKLFVIGIGVFGALGVMQWLAADKAEKAMHAGTAPVAPVTPTESPVSENTTEPVEPVAPTDVPPQV